mgnify:CR=1 FL=1
MQWQSNPYVVPLLIAGLISFINAMVVSTRRRVPGAGSLLGAMLAVSLWSFAYAFELASGDLHWQVLWAKVEYLGIVCVPMFFLTFSLEYSRKNSKSANKALWLLGIVPLVCLALVWTNELHGLIWTQVSQKDGGGFLLLSVEHGIAFWAWAAFSYLVLLASSVILIRDAISSSSEFRQQAIIMVIGLLITWAGNAVYLLGLSPVPDLDITSVAFILTMIIFTIGIFRFGILDIMPIASENILDNLEDSIIVLDNSNRIVYVNNSLEYYTHTEAKQLVGRSAVDAFSPWPGLKALSDIDNSSRGEVVINGNGPNPFHFDTRISTIYWKNNKFGRIFILSDISERRLAEKGFQPADYDPETFSPGDYIPVIFVYRMLDEKLIEINRSFIAELGYDRRDAIGKTLLQLGVWDPYERVEFHRVISKEKTLDSYPLMMKGKNGEQRSFIISARWLEIESNIFVMVMAKPVRE